MDIHLVLNALWVIQVWMCAVYSSATKGGKFALLDANISSFAASVCLFTCLFIRLSVNPFFCLFTYLILFVCLFVHLTIHLFGVHSSLLLFSCLSLFLSLIAFHSLCLQFTVYFRPFQFTLNSSFSSIIFKSFRLPLFFLVFSFVYYTFTFFVLLLCSCNTSFLFILFIFISILFVCFLCNSFLSLFLLNYLWKPFIPFLPPNPPSHSDANDATASLFRLEWTKTKMLIVFPPFYFEQKNCLEHLHVLDIFIYNVCEWW